MPHVRNCDPEEPGADEMCAFTESVTQLMVFAIHAKYGSSSWIPPVISIEGRRKSACIATFEKKKPKALHYSRERHILSYGLDQERMDVKFSFSLSVMTPLLFSYALST